MSPIWVLVVTALAFGTADSRNILCYYQPTSYAAPKDLNPSYCTHLVFAFGLISNNTIVPVKSSDTGIYAQLVKFRSTHPDLKIILSLQKNFPPVANSSTDVKKLFALNAIKFLRKYSFDGVDFDWEWPKSKERDSFTSLLQIFRQAVDTESHTTGKAPLIMTAALIAASNVAKYSYDVPSLNRILDLVTVMTYDFHRYIPSKDTVTGYNSPLYKTRGEYVSVALQLKLYLSLGFHPSKLLMGVATYGRSWKLKDPNQNDVHAPAVGNGDPGPVRHLKGVYTYPDVCMTIQSGATTVFDVLTKASYLYQNTSWVSYDDPFSLRKKCSFVRDNDLAGVGVWAVHLDDVHNVCHSGSFPLLSTLRYNL